MVYDGKSSKSGWFGGTTIFGNIHVNNRNLNKTNMANPTRLRLPPFFHQPLPFDSQGSLPGCHSETTECVSRLWPHRPCFQDLQAILVGGWRRGIDRKHKGLTHWWTDSCRESLKHPPILQFLRNDYDIGRTVSGFGWLWLVWVFCCQFFLESRLVIQKKTDKQSPPSCIFSSIPENSGTSMSYKGTIPLYGCFQKIGVLQNGYSL